MTKTAFVQCITGSRLVFAAAVAVLTVWSGTERWALWCTLPLIVVIELTDLLDGFLARRLGVVTEFGKMFDPFSDAVCHLVIYWSLARIELCWFTVPLVLALRDLTVAYIRVTLSGAGRDVSARITGKIKVWVLALCAILLVFLTLVAGPLSAGTIALFSILAMTAPAVALAHHLIAAWPSLKATLRAR